MQKISDRLSNFLDTSRWIAAAAVVSDHARILIFAPIDPSRPGIPIKVLYFATGFGRIAVVIFFALSGFLVGGEVVRQIKCGEFSWRQYAIKRFSRIYPAYLLALALGGALDWIGIHYFNTQGIYSGGVVFPGIHFSVLDRLNASVLGQNLLFLQGNTCQVFGSNQPLWSVAYEAWYYLLFPLLLWPVLCREARPLVRISVLIAAGCVMVFIRGEILWYFLVWLVGLLPHAISGRLLAPRVGSLCVLALITSAARLGLFPGLEGYPYEVLISLSFAVCINAFSRSDTQPLRGARTGRFLASFSYSLYATHWPLLLLIVSASRTFFQFGLRQAPGAGPVVFWMLVVVLCYGIALATATLTEFRTQPLRRRLSEALSAGVPGSSPPR